ncbi:serine hydrolase [Catalinimonas sp. 4WD22]|uniref:serine hydrolase domain-containing protein n=1 Tax=Catalinimonas locisalis TaxID=3133978 RepID=UPI003100F448
MIIKLPYQAVLLLLSLFIYFEPLHAQQVYYPDQNKWEEKSPDEAGINADQLNEAVKFAQEHEYEGARDLRIAILKGFEREPYHTLAGPVKERGGPAGLIIKDGYIVAQWGDVERIDMTFSVTKSYLSTVAGLAMDEGLIGSVDDPVEAYVWDGTFKGEHNSKIQWKHLLNQSSDWSGSLFGMYDWADRPPTNGGIDEWKNRSLLEPGTNFEYNDVRVNVLAYALLQVWRKPLPMVLKEKIMDPIGASSTWRWFGYENSFVNVDGIKMQSVSGGGHSGGGLFINTLDHARFGLLFLRNGKWDGQQLISESWVEDLQQSSAANESYGYMWWLNKGERKWEGVNESVYYAAGFGGNFIVVDQENDLVVVTRWLNPPQIGEMMKLVTDAL